MQPIFIAILLGLTASCSAVVNGPYLFWGLSGIANLQPHAMVQVDKQKLINVYKAAETILIFYSNNTFPLNSGRYHKFEQLVKSSTWQYLPQYSLIADPIEYNDNVEFIDLDESPDDADNRLITDFNEACNIHGSNKVLGILANSVDDPYEDAHNLVKRDTKETFEDDMRSTTTAQTPIEEEETDKSFIYVADGFKAILYVNSAPIIHIDKKLNGTKLIEHNKAITFDDQRAKGYGRLNIIFAVDGEKLFVRFNFTLVRGTWSMKAVDVEYKEYKSILPVVGSQYTIPSAPLGFSYRCSAHKLLFSDGIDRLIINDYQVQPWLNGRTHFGEVYDCIGFTTSPIWAGVLVSFFLCGILAVGIIALMDIKAPNRFENTRSKPLSFFVQE